MGMEGIDMSFAIGSLSIILGAGLVILGIVLQIRSNRKSMFVKYPDL